MPSMTIDKAKFLVIDFEMTGLDPETDEIVEVAAIPVTGFNIGIDPGFYSEIEPKRSVPASTKAVHGLRGRELAGAPNAQEVLPELVQMFNNRIVVGHNIECDLSFLRHKAMRIGIMPPKRPLVDTSNLAGAIWPGDGRISLDELLRKFDLERPRGHHNALDDARLTATLFIKMTHSLKAQGRISTVADLLKIGGLR
jgi:DNA polymerase-3 subunit alpha (Gram-positive type)